MISLFSALCSKPALARIVLLTLASVTVRPCSLPVQREVKVSGSMEENGAGLRVFSLLRRFSTGVWGTASEMLSTLYAGIILKMLRKQLTC